MNCVQMNQNMAFHLRHAKSTYIKCFECNIEWARCRLHFEAAYGAMKL